MASTGRPAANADSRRDRAPRGRGADGCLSARRRFLSSIPALATAAGFVLIAAAPVSAAPSAEELKRGEDLLITYCGSCHATGRTGDSRRPDAPAFRTLGQRYPIDSLEESLGEGIMAGHPDMPEMSFEGDEVGAIVDYLKSIQVR